jgi:hypothetical protein
LKFLKKRRAGEHALARPDAIAARMDPEYARVSTGGQSLDGQLAKLKQHGASVIHREKVSGARSARGRGITGAVAGPGLKEGLFQPAVQGWFAHRGPNFLCAAESTAALPQSPPGSQKSTKGGPVPSRSRLVTR